jgi:hypothetical protein
MGTGGQTHLTSLETCSADRLPPLSPPALFLVPTLILVCSLSRRRRLEERIQRGAGRRDKKLGPSHKWRSLARCSTHCFAAPTRCHSPHVPRTRQPPNSMEHQPPWDASSRSVGPEISRCFWNLTVHYRVHQTPPLHPPLNQMNPVNIQFPADPL